MWPVATMRSVGRRQQPSGFIVFNQDSLLFAVFHRCSSIAAHYSLFVNHHLLIMTKLFVNHDYYLLIIISYVCLLSSRMDF